MKLFVVLGAFAAAGCNQILGLDPTVPVDAGQPPDAPLPIARLTWLVADTDAAGAPLPAPLLTPMDPAPTVQVGRIAGPLTATPYLPDGSFTIPADFPGTPWRVVYAVPGDATPVEVQWTTSPERIPHVTEPFVGHLPRMSLPGPASAMTVTPTGTGVSFSSARVAFTGVWGESPTTSAVGTTLTFNLNNVAPFTGPKGAPEPARGDRVMVIDYTMTTANGVTCRNSRASTSFPLEASTGTVAVTPNPAWSGSTTAVSITYSLEQWVTIYGVYMEYNGGFVGRRMAFGKVPTQAVPMFIRRRDAEALRMPPMIPLADCYGDTAAPPDSLTTVDVLANVPDLAYGQFTSTRLVTNTTIPLVSGYVSAVAGIPGSPDRYQLDTAAAILIPPLMLGSLDLAVDDHAMLPAGSEPLELTFGATAIGQAGAIGDTDYYEVVLHQLTAAGITPVRTFRVLERSVSIDRGLLTSGSEYVFELRNFAGAPQAKAGDFTVYTIPQSQAVTFTRTFIAP